MKVYRISTRKVKQSGVQIEKVSRMQGHEYLNELYLVDEQAWIW